MIIWLKVWWTARGLSSSRIDRRIQAVVALGRYGKSAIEPLIAALKDQEPAVWLPAVEALSLIGGLRATEALLAKLSARSYVQSETAEFERGLLRIKEPEVVARLITEALTSQCEWVRRVVVNVLQASAWSKIHPEQRVELAVAAHLVQVAVREGAVAVDPLLKALHGRDQFVVGSAAESLGLLGDLRAVEPLLAVLRNRREMAAWLPAIEALGRLRDSRAVDRLAELLLVSPWDSGEWGRVSKVAAQALGEIGDTRAVPSLIKAMGFFHTGVAVVQALGKLGDPRALVPLVEALAPARGTIGAEQAAGEAILKIGGAAAVDALLPALKNQRACRPAARLLSSLGDPRAKDALYAALQDWPHEWCTLVTVLARLGDRRIIESLIAALPSPDDRVRKAAVLALDELGWVPMCAEQRVALALAVGDSPRAVAAGKEAVDPLVLALLSADGRVRRTAVTALQALGWQPATAAERAIHAAVCGRYVDASKEGEASIAPLVLMFLHPYQSDSKEAAEALIPYLDSPKIGIDVLKKMTLMPDDMERIGEFPGYSSYEQVYHGASGPTTIETTVKCYGHVRTAAERALTSRHQKPN